MLVEEFDARQVANAFVNQYYAILHDRPHDVPEFFHESSPLGWPRDDVRRTSATTLEGINETNMSSESKDWNVQIKTVDAQHSIDGGVLVAVSGCFIMDVDNTKKNFMQAFFLAKQETGFFVLNDILRFTDPTHDSEPSGGCNPMHEEAVVKKGNVDRCAVDNATITTTTVKVSKPSSVPSKKHMEPIDSENCQLLCICFLFVAFVLLLGILVDAYRFGWSGLFQKTT